MTRADLLTVLPEALLALAALAALMWGVFGGKDRLALPILWATAALLAALAVWIAAAGEGARTAFGGLFVDDAFARFAKVVLLAAAAAVLAMAAGVLGRRGLLRFEFPVLVALAALGMMMMVSAGDLMALYMGLELQSLALYVIAAMRRDSVRSTEAGLKYFVLGALASGLMLYGASLAYGFAGTTGFAGILEALAAGETPLGLLFGLVFLLAGLSFKVSAVPFHMWTPDVYEGAPTPVTAFFATAPKVAAMALIARLVHDAFGPAGHDWRQVVALLAVASMFLGAVAGIGQRDFKRLMAYSSIGHMGFALVGLAAGSATGVQTMLVYLAIYATMNVGVFAFILAMEREGRHLTDLASLGLLARREPTAALALMILLFSLAGVPPLLGFFAKYGVLLAAVEADMAWLALAGVIASVISAFYYIRIVYLMYFGDEGEGLDGAMTPAQKTLLVVTAAVMVAGIVNLFGIEAPAAAAAQALVR
ncbi:MAG: NADH-quinone oxidoreductase subunit NuoN [Rhodobacteraceae bacterium]|nr:NADH-quinone oxidoreductase subunit NuoN [Paracoccaceae bacterium]